MTATIINPAGTALTWALRELLGALPERRDWLNPEAESVLRAALTEPTPVAKMVAEVAAELDAELRAAAPVADQGDPATWPQSPACRLYVKDKSPGNTESAATGGQPFAWMRPNEIAGLLDHAKRNTENRYYGRVYAEQYDPDMVRVYAQATPTPNATGETDREMALRFKREADALWHRVHEAEHSAARGNLMVKLLSESNLDYATLEGAPVETIIEWLDFHFPGAPAAVDALMERGEPAAPAEPKPCKACDPSVNYVCEEHGEPEDRKTVLLTAAHALLKKQAWTSEVLNLLSETVHYDGTDCDGLCLISDIEDELGLDGEARPA